MGKMIERLERPDTYAVWSKNETTRFYSTSGELLQNLQNILLITME